MPPHETSSTTGILKLLKNNYFVALWVAQILSQLADKILLILLIAIATSPEYPALIPVNSLESSIMIASTLPAIFLGSLAGIYVDLHSKRKVMITCNFLRGALVILIPLLPKALALLLLATFLIFTLTQAFAPAEQSAIPLLVPKSNLMAANALFTTTMMGSLIVGFAIGSLLLNLLIHLAPQWSHFIRELFVGGLYLLSGVVLFVLPQNEEITPREDGANVWADLRDGLRYVRHSRLISGAMLQLVILYSVLAALLKLSTNLTEIITQNRADFGFLLAATGVGLALGAVILGQFGKRFIHYPLPLIGFIGISFVLLAFAVVTELWLALALAAFLGFHGALIVVPMQTVIQEHTPENMRGKVFGLLNNAQNIAASLPLALTAVALDIATGFMGKIGGFQVVLICISLIVVFLGILGWSRTHYSPEKAS